MFQVNLSLQKLHWSLLIECRFTAKHEICLFRQITCIDWFQAPHSQLLFCSTLFSLPRRPLLCFHADVFTSSPSIEQLQQLFALLLSSRNIKRAQVWGDWRPDAAINTTILGHRLDGLTWQLLRLVSVSSQRLSRQVATAHTTVNTSQQRLSAGHCVTSCNPVLCRLPSLHRFFTIVCSARQVGPARAMAFGFESKRRNVV